MPEFIDSYSLEIFNSIEENNYFIKLNYDLRLEKVVELFSDINALHPFREGNGRTQREFIEELSKICGIDLDLTSVSKMDMIIASHEGINGHNEKLYKIFKENSKQLSFEKQVEYIEIYCSKKLAGKLKKELYIIAK